MNISTSKLCDFFADSVDVVDPLFSDYGAKTYFNGIVTTIKCFESYGLINKVLSENGEGRILLIDAGGSTRRAVLDIKLVKLACKNHWEGIVCYGSVRDVAEISKENIGIKALAAIPVMANESDFGEIDLPVNFAGVTFLPEDYLYADLSGIVISPNELIVE